MKALAVAGPSGDGTTSFVDDLIAALAERGRVGTVTLDGDATIDAAVGDETTPREAGAARTYAIGPDGWVGTGEERSLTDALDSLAIDCEYAIVEADGDVDLPTIAFGEEVAPTVEDAVLTAQSPADIAIGDAVAAIESIEPYETLESLVASVKRSSDDDRAGAIATFTGRVRERDGPNDEPTEFLEFERYDGVADERTATIREEIEARDGVYDVRLHHKTGVVEAGEDIVFVVVLAGHRAEAFRAVEDGINRLKEEVPLFKREVTVTDEFWAHQR